MTLSDEYAKQFAWRDWGTALASCPLKSGEKILDLGCGPGDISAELAKRGAQVVGVDVDEDLLSVARKRDLRGCVFLNQDLKSLVLEPNSFDGIWCSFTAAYFPNFESVLRGWIPLLKPNGWICLTEMDDLFGHEPMPEHFRTKLDAFYSEAFGVERYDFRAGHKVSKILRRAGFRVQERLLADQELAFSGPADPAVLRAWSDRLNRMVGLKSFLGADFEGFRSSFLTTLAANEHQSKCRVFCVVGTRQ